MSVSPQVLDWWRAGERALTGTVTDISDAGLTEASLLPGWSRQTLLAHVTRNADALGNLLAWARTGVPTPMYATPGTRAEDIEQTATLPPGDLREQFRTSQERLAAAIAELPQAAWDAQVETAQGNQVPATEVPWLRARESWLHGIDFGGRMTFADVPRDLAAALLAEITGVWASRDGAVFTLVATDGDERWGRGPEVVSAPLADLLGWATGRSGRGAAQVSGAPAAPRWL
jgi:maleylpyruvate isomerase